jgi:hypothetical protein
MFEDLQPLQATGSFIRADFPNHPLVGTRLEKAMSDALSRMSQQMDDRGFRFLRPRWNREFEDAEDRRLRRRYRVLREG